MRSNEAMRQLCDVLNTEIGAGLQFEIALRLLVAKYRRQHDRRMHDAQAEELLKFGADFARQKTGKARSTLFKMRQRARLRSTQKQQA